MKNRYIEFERFIASIMVLLYHLGSSKGGWIFVEFFFLLTGYFTMLHIEQKHDSIENNIWYPISYTWKKFTKLIPYTGCSVIIMWILYAISNSLSFTELLKWLLCLPAELLLIAATGMMPEGLQIGAYAFTPRLLNGSLWYICSMLFVLPVAMALLTYSKKWKGIIVTILPLFLYGFLILRDGTINGWHGDKFSFIFCNMRAIAGILLGALLYYVVKWWKLREYTVLGKWMLTGLEIISFIAVIVISSAINFGYDALQIGLIFLSLSLTNSGVTYTSRITNKNLEFLGAISLPIYCLQTPIFSICGAFGIESVLVQFVIVLAAGAVYELGLKLIKQWFHPYKKRLRDRFIV